MSRDGQTERAFKSGEQIRKINRRNVYASLVLLALSVIEGFVRVTLPACQSLGGPCTRWAYLYITVPLFVISIAGWAWTRRKTDEELDSIASRTVNRKEKPRCLRE